MISTRRALTCRLPFLHLPFSTRLMSGNPPVSTSTATAQSSGRRRDQESSAAPATPGPKTPSATQSQSQSPRQHKIHHHRSPHKTPKRPHKRSKTRTTDLAQATSPRSSRLEGSTGDTEMSRDKGSEEDDDDLCLDGPLTSMDGQVFGTLDEFIDRLRINSAEYETKLSGSESSKKSLDTTTTGPGRVYDVGGDGSPSRKKPKPWDKSSRRKRGRKQGSQKTGVTSQSSVVVEETVVSTVSEPQRQLDQTKDNQDQENPSSPEVISEYVTPNPGGRKMVDRGIDLFTKKKAIFISVDLEWWERNDRLLTEVGMAIYDPSSDVQGPGKIPIIHYEHFIIKEHLKKVNGRFVSDQKYHCSFVEDSKVIALADCREAYRQIIQLYEAKAAKQNMSVIYVGHNFSGDLEVLRREKFYTGDHEVFDTMIAWKTNPTAEFYALHKILKSLHIPHGLLHNATNDAHYTLMLAMYLCDPVYRDWKGLDKPFEQNIRWKTSKQKVKNHWVVCGAEEAVSYYKSANLY